MRFKKHRPKKQQQSVFLLYFCSGCRKHYRKKKLMAHGANFDFKFADDLLMKNQWTTTIDKKSWPPNIGYILHECEAGKRFGHAEFVGLELAT